MEDRAETTRDAPQQVLAETQANVSETAEINLPRIENLRRTIRFQRQEGAAQLVNPISGAAILVLPFPYDQILNGGQLFLYDRGVGDISCILAFATNQVVNYWQILMIWFRDSLFKFSPEIFFQQYTIHVKIHQRVIPSTSPQIFGMPNAEISQHLRMIPAVPFVPPNDAVTVFKELRGEIRKHMMQMSMKYWIISKINTSVDVEEMLQLDLIQ